MQTGFAKYNYKTKVNTFNMVPTDKMIVANHCCLKDNNYLCSKDSKYG